MSRRRRLRVRQGNREETLRGFARIGMFPLSSRRVDLSGRRPPVEPYPATVSECLRPGKRYRPAALRALRAFRATRQWRSSPLERAVAFQRLHRALCAAYGLRTQLYIVGGPDAPVCGSGASGYSWRLNRIVLRGRLSLVTYLHEFGHALGKGERGACVYSINLFRRIFPRSFARLRPVGHTLQRRRGS